MSEESHGPSNLEFFVVFLCCPWILYDGPVKVIRIHPFQLWTEDTDALIYGADTTDITYKGPVSHLR